VGSGDSSCRACDHPTLVGWTRNEAAYVELRLELFNPLHLVDTSGELLVKSRVLAPWTHR
jgi:hypothetical protein